MYWRISYFSKAIVLIFQKIEINITVFCRQPLIAGMYLMMSVDTVIPAGEKGK